MTFHVPKAPFIAKERHRQSERESERETERDIQPYLVHVLVYNFPRSKDTLQRRIEHQRERGRERHSKSVRNQKMETHRDIDRAGERARKE